MKKILFSISMLLPYFLFAQLETEVYLMDVVSDNGNSILVNLRNISNNKGYDNQPSFLDDNTLLFSSTRNGQTDIATYDIAAGKNTWISNTSGGSEYSPLKIPKKNEASAIRLDTTGLQRLYRYDLKTGQSEELLRDLKVGYHVWFNEDIIVSSVLVEDRMDLVVSNLKDHSNYTTQKQVGRSLHKIPNTDLISYISKEENQWHIKSLNPVSGSTEKLAPMIPEVEDMVWLTDGTILAAKGKVIFKVNPKTEGSWSVFQRLDDKNVHNITRLTVSPNGKQLAIVSGQSPEIIIQKQVESYNQGDLDAFVSCFSGDVLVRNFPNDTLYTGNKTMKANYKNYLDNNPDSSVEVKKRIVMGNIVIDEEIADQTSQQVAIYTVENDLITSMTFIFDDSPEGAEAIVQKQLDAYNKRDIDAFMATYTDDVSLYNFPDMARSKGKEQMRMGYSTFFNNTPDLNCKIKNRIVIGNKVIDEEFITMNGNTFSAVAIYEVEDGKISKVTFIQ